MNRRDLFKSVCACAAAPVVVDAPAAAKASCFEYLFFDCFAAELVRVAQGLKAMGCDVPEEFLDQGRKRDELIARFREEIPK